MVHASSVQGAGGRTDVVEYHRPLAAETATPQIITILQASTCGAGVPPAGWAGGKSEIRNPKSQIQYGWVGGNSKFKTQNDMMTGSSYEPSQNFILSEASPRDAESKDLWGGGHS
jgi:hypothetical protein